MNTHPYLRAYMAGSVVPTVFLLVVISGFVAIRYIARIPVPLERGIIFPMAFVPNLFGVWNVLYVLRKTNGHPLAIGLHGACLPCLLGPMALLLGTILGLVEITPSGLLYLQTVHAPYALVAIGFCCALIVYYFVWKYLVGFLNEVLGIA